jgi:hypothetical protein
MEWRGPEAVVVLFGCPRSRAHVTPNGHADHPLGVLMTSDNGMKSPVLAQVDRGRLSTICLTVRFQTNSTVDGALAS